MDRLGCGEDGSLGNRDQVGGFWNIQVIGSGLHQGGDVSLGQIHILFKDEADSICWWIRGTGGEGKVVKKVKEHTSQLFSWSLWELSFSEAGCGDEQEPCLGAGQEFGLEPWGWKTPFSKDLWRARCTCRPGA